MVGLALAQPHHSVQVQMPDDAVPVGAFHTSLLQRCLARQGILLRRDTPPLSVTVAHCHSTDSPRNTTQTGPIRWTGTRPRMSE